MDFARLSISILLVTVNFSLRLIHYNVIIKTITYHKIITMPLHDTIIKVTKFLETSYENPQLESPAYDPIGKVIHEFLRFLRAQYQNNTWIAVVRTKIEEIKQKLPQNHILKVKFIHFLDQLNNDLEKEDLDITEKLEASIIGNKVEGLDDNWTIIKSASDGKAEQQLSTQSTLFASVQLSNTSGLDQSLSTSAIDIPEPKKQSWWPIPGMF